MQASVYLTIAMLILVGLAGILITISLLVRRINKNNASSDEERHEGLRNSVLRFRLSKMLEYLGVDIHEYIRKLPEDEILKHISRCGACPNTEACDRYLRDGKYVKSMDFCPNYPSLIASSKILANSK